MCAQKVACKPVGLTKDAGYQIGVRRTLPFCRDRVWDFLISPAGLKIWLGDLSSLPLTAGESYRTREGTFGEMRVAKPKEQLRLTWQPAHWPNPSTLQIRLLTGHPEKTTISFHQEKLDDLMAREAMKTHWEDAIARITASLN